MIRASAFFGPQTLPLCSGMAYRYFLLLIPPYRSTQLNTAMTGCHNEHSLWSEEVCWISSWQTLQGFIRGAISKRLQCPPAAVATFSPNGSTITHYLLAILYPKLPFHDMPILNNYCACLRSPILHHTCGRAANACSEHNVNTIEPANTESREQPTHQDPDHHS